MWSIHGHSSIKSISCNLLNYRPFNLLDLLIKWWLNFQNSFNKRVLSVKRTTYSTLWMIFCNVRCRFTTFVRNSITIFCRQINFSNIRWFSKIVMFLFRDQNNYWKSLGRLGQQDHLYMKVILYGIKKNYPEKLNPGLKCR